MTPEREARIKKVAEKRQAGFILVLDGIHDPHNAGAIMRTCDAFGVQEVCLIFEEGKSFNPRQVGKVSSSSANRWLTFRKFKTSEECFEALKLEGYFIVATALADRGVNPYTTDLTQEKIALVVGNEHRGISPVFMEGADMLLTIPMQGFVESLNVSVASALCIAEITRQRNEKGGKSLSPSDIESLVGEWSKEK